MVSDPYNNDGVPYNKDKLTIDEHLEYFGERLTCKKRMLLFHFFFRLCILSSILLFCEGNHLMFRTSGNRKKLTDILHTEAYTYFTSFLNTIF